MGLRNFLNRRWLLLALGAVLGGLAAYFASQQMHSDYRATATVLINRVATSADPTATEPLTAERLSAYAQVATAPTVLDSVRQRLALPLSQAALKQKISVSTIAGSQMLNISVSDPNPQLAAVISNGVAQAFIDDRAAQQPPTATLTIAKPAETPHASTGSSLFLDLDVGILAGLLLATATGVWLDRRQRGLLPQDDVDSTPEPDATPSRTPVLQPAFETPLYVAPPLHRKLGAARNLVARRDSVPVAQPVSSEALERRVAALRAPRPAADAPAMSWTALVERPAVDPQAGTNAVSVATRPPTPLMPATEPAQPIAAVPAAVPVAAAPTTVASVASAPAPATPMAAAASPAEPVAAPSPAAAPVATIFTPTAPVAPPAPPPAPVAIDLLGATLKELLARADDTANLIRSLRPENLREET